MAHYPVYRLDGSTASEHSANFCRTMAPQIYQYRRVVGHHFALRHADPRRRDACRNWIKAFRRDLMACGWSAHARAVNQSFEGV